MHKMKFNSRQLGMSLIEVLVALALSAFLLFGIITIFDTNKQASTYQNALGRVQESGRIAIELLARDIRMADYWGCAATSNDPAATKTFKSGLDTSDPDYSAGRVTAMQNAFLNQQGLQVQDDVTSLTIDTITVKDNTDVITVIGAAPQTGLQIREPYMNIPSAALQVDPGVQVKEGDILIISDCAAADMFSVSSTTTSTKTTLNHNTGNITATGAINNATSDFSKTYRGDAQIVMPYSKTYFIGRQNATDNWSLWQLRTTGSAEEVLRDVVDMQLVYGEDTVGSFDGLVDVFTDGSGVSDTERVVSVRVELDVENTDIVENGNNFTKTFVTTANIRNRSR